MDFTVHTFFDYYIFHPLKAPTQKERLISLIATVALGVFSLGVVHIICAAKLYQKNIKQHSGESPQDKKMTEVFDREVSRKEGEAVENVEKEKKTEIPVVKIIRLAGEDIDVHHTIREAEDGDGFHQYILGRMYLSGKGVEQSNEKGIHWLQKSAAKGNADAMFQMGKLYQFGHASKQSDELAAVWYRGAALSGHVESQYRLGAFYHRGVGLKLSDVDAVAWYTKAANQGHLRALNNLAVMHYYGKGVEESTVKAVDLLLKAKELGSEVAANNLEQIGKNVFAER